MSHGPNAVDYKKKKNIRKQMVYPRTFFLYNHGSIFGANSDQQRGVKERLIYIMHRERSPLKHCLPERPSTCAEPGHNLLSVS